MDGIFTPRTWLAYATLIQEASTELDLHRSELLDQSVETLPERLYQLDLSHSEGIEAAIRHFSRNTTWPQLTAIESACIYVRLGSAWRTLFLLATLSTGEHPVKIPTGPGWAEEEEIYEWSLITIWNFHGRQQLASTLQAILRLLGYEDET